MSTLLTLIINKDPARVIDFVVMAVILVGILLLIKDKYECGITFAYHVPLEEMASESPKEMQGGW